MLGQYLATAGQSKVWTTTQSLACKSSDGGRRSVLAGKILHRGGTMNDALCFDIDVSNLDNCPIGKDGDQCPNS